jgi:hypothetical protein
MRGVIAVLSASLAGATTVALLTLLRRERETVVTQMLPIPRSAL